ncbi:hypothetical protein C8R45DRAFT_930770 [Mycena sanguinolenta]|nr:hypothetical protein C8R45DRAFT_930770 [Mycena sanguinolenta]
MASGEKPGLKARLRRERRECGCYAPAGDLVLDNVCGCVRGNGRPGRLALEREYAGGGSRSGKRRNAGTAEPVRKRHEGLRRDPARPKRQRKNREWALALRKLKVGQERRRAGWTENNISTATPSTLTELQPASAPLPEHSTIIEALESIKRLRSRIRFWHVCMVSHAELPYPGLSRWIGRQRRHEPERHTGPLHVRTIKSMIYWVEHSVSDSLEYSPERCTIIAAYNRLVVGVAIISSPRETYISGYCIACVTEQFGHVCKGDFRASLGPGDPRLTTVERARYQAVSQMHETAQPASG